MKGSETERWFISMYEAEADAVFRFCLFKLRDRELATDIAQETFVRMWDYVARGSELSNFRAFAFRVARNAIADYIKKNRPVYEHELGDMADEIMNAPVLGDAESRAELSGVLGCLKGLPEEDQEMVLLRYTEQMPVKEIAESLGQLPNTVTQRLKRAIESLRNCLGIVTT